MVETGRHCGQSRAEMCKPCSSSYRGSLWAFRLHFLKRFLLWVLWKRFLHFLRAAACCPVSGWKTFPVLTTSWAAADSGAKTSGCGEAVTETTRPFVAIALR